MTDPNIRLQVDPDIGLEVDVDRVKSARDDVLASVRKGHICPTFPLRNVPDTTSECREVLEAAYAAAAALIYGPLPTLDECLDAVKANADHLRCLEVQVFWPFRNTRSPSTPSAAAVSPTAPMYIRTLTVVREGSPDR